MALTLHDRRVMAVIRSTGGHFFEMFDFILFGFYATYISHTFFPAGTAYASLMLTLLTFGAGFLMRPLGAIVLGAYIDRVGPPEGADRIAGPDGGVDARDCLHPRLRFTIGAAWHRLLVLLGRLVQGLLRRCRAGRRGCLLGRDGAAAATRASSLRGSRWRSRLA